MPNTSEKIGPLLFSDLH